MNRHSSTDEFRRFANELRLFAAVGSEHLSSPIDAGQQNGQLFYTIPYYSDGSLNRNDGKQLPVDQIVQAISDAARGAHALHEVGVAHRDIKPSNVMLDDGRGRLTDLGLAQVLDPGLTITGTGPIGSLECMAPFRVLGGKANRATEVWELGATLHKAITRESIMGEIPDHDILAALRYVSTAKPTISDALPEDLHSIVSDCVSEDPRNRPATALELAERLEALL